MAEAEFLADLLVELVNQCVHIVFTDEWAFLTGRKKTEGEKDCRTRKDRKGLANKAWDAQYPELIDAYLAFEREGAPSPPPDCTMYEPLTAIGVLSQELLSVPVVDGQGFVLTLARNGYLATAPLCPSTAVYFETLRIFHSARSRCASMNIKAFVRGLCELHSVCTFNALK